MTQNPGRSAGGEEAFGKFDFGLSDAEEELAARLHAESLIIDLVFQHPGGYRVFEQEPIKTLVAERAGGKSGLELYGAVGVMLAYEADLAGTHSLMREGWDASGVTVGEMTIDPHNPLGGAVPAGQLADGLPWLRRVVRADEMRQAKEDGVHAMFGYCQPVHGIPGDLAKVEEAYHLGLRVLMLTYNNSDLVGCGCTERFDHGLTNFGIGLVACLDKLGIIVDTSHCGKLTTLDACTFSSRPVIANHTSAGALHPHARAKTDEELDAIAETGGVIGVCAVPFFLTDKEDADINAMLDHIDYMANRIGWEHVAIGTDWPLTIPRQLLSRLFSPELMSRIGFRSEHNIQPEKNLIGFDDYRDFPNITRGLVSRGYGEKEIRGILGANFLRVFEDVCG